MFIEIFFMRSTLVLCALPVVSLTSGFLFQLYRQESKAEWCNTLTRFNFKAIYHRI